MLQKCTKLTPCKFLQQAKAMKVIGECLPNHPAIAQKGYNQTSPYQVALDTSENLYQIPSKLVMDILKGVSYSLLSVKQV